MLCHMLFLCVGGYTAPAAVGRAFRGPGVLLQRGTFMTAPDPAQPEQGLAAPEQLAGRATAGRASQQRHSKVESSSKGGAGEKKHFVTKPRRDRMRNSSPAAEKAHELGRTLTLTLTLTPTLTLSLTLTLALALARTLTLTRCTSWALLRARPCRPPSRWTR